MSLELLKDQEWALTWEARAAVHGLKQRWKLDEDLALSLLEKIWPESFIYELCDDSIPLHGREAGDSYGND